MSNDSVRIAVIFSAIITAAMIRLLPHPPNFTPIAAMALFSGAHLDRRWLAFVAPLGALFVSDCVIGFYPHMEFVYSSFTIIVVIGALSLRHPSLLRVGGAAAASSALFYAVTNFGVWLTLGTYPHSVAGFLACYVAAIPYFRNTLAGDLFYSALLFGGFALLQRGIPALQPASESKAST